MTVRCRMLVALWLAACVDEGGKIGVRGEDTATTVTTPTGIGPTTTVLPTTDTTPTTTEPAPVEASEVFVYDAPVVDILFVIDASGSMVANTEVLIGSLQSLVDDWTARGIDFHAGVTNMDEDPEQGKLEIVGGAKWSDPTQPYPGQLLMDLVDAVEDPSSTEQGRAAAYKALELVDVGEPNEGFLRADSEVAIIFHGDETDQSGDVPISEQGFIDYVLALRPAGRATMHAIAGTEEYLGYTIDTGGVAWSVSNLPYGPALAAITDSFDETNLFTLAGAPLDGVVEVTVTELDGTVTDLLVDEFSFDPATNLVDLLDYYPGDGATVTVTYDVLE